MKAKVNVYRGPAAFVLSALFSSTACFQAERTNLDGSNPTGLLLMQLVQPTTTTTPATVPAYVAVGNNCSVWTSADGTSWVGSSTALPDCSGANVYDIVYTIDTYIAVGGLTGGSGCGIWTSTNGTTWTRQTCGTGDPLMPLRSVAANPSGFVVAGGSSGGSRCPGQRTATAGVFTSWSQHFVHGSGNSCTTGQYIADIAYAGSYWSAVCSAASCGSGPAWEQRSSTTGITFADNAMGGLNNTYRVTPGPSNRIYAFGSESIATGGYYSTDGFATEVATTGLAIGGGPTGGAAFGSGTLIVAGASCQYQMSTNGGTVWSTLQIMGNCTSTDWTTVAARSSTSSFAVGGTTSGATRFAHSSTGTKDSYTIITPTGVTNQTVNAIAAKP